MKHLLQQLRRFTSPTVYNALENITTPPSAKISINRDQTTDFMPTAGPVVGFAVTVTVRSYSRKQATDLASKWEEYRRYAAHIPGPKVVVVQDLDKPGMQACFWGEVNAAMHRAFGCVGTITDGAVRDIDEIGQIGFKVLARGLRVGHAHVAPVKWGIPVRVFGTVVRPGCVIHADKHGFVVIGTKHLQRVVDSALYFDSLECQTVLAAVGCTAGLSVDKILQVTNEAKTAFLMRIAKKHSPVR